MTLVTEFSECRSNLRPGIFQIGEEWFRHLLNGKPTIVALENRRRLHRAGFPAETAKRDTSLATVEKAATTAL
jgi:hypothetical protein